MVRRGENIYKRKDGRWEGRYKKTRDKQGKIVYGYIYGKKYSEVREKLSLKQKDTLKSMGTFFQGTVEEWVSYWLHDAIKDQVKQSTWTSYEAKLRIHIIPFLGRKKLFLLEKTDIQEFLLYLSEQNYSDNTIKNIFTILKNSINYAIANDYLATNPCKNIATSVKEVRKIHALSITAQKKLEHYEFNEQYCSAVIIGLATGMRIGEICGLRWTDIDFNEDIINIERTLQRIPDPDRPKKTKIIMNSPKTKGSFRKIPLAKNLKTYLLKKKEQINSEYVVSSNGSFTEPRVINYRLKKTIEKTNLEPFNFHALRHTFATRCIESGVDISSLSKLLGHTSTKLTLDTYADSLWEKRKEAVERIDQQQFYQLL